MGCNYEEEREAVLIGVWGETSAPYFDGPDRTIEAWSPDGLPPETCDREDCLTGLRYGFGPYAAPEGYVVDSVYSAGERECPWCGDGTGEEHRRPDCQLCEGDGLIFLGEDVAIVIFAPRYSVTCGFVGCLYGRRDLYTTLQDARNAAAEILWEERGMENPVRTVDSGTLWALGTHGTVHLRIHDEATDGL